MKRFGWSVPAEVLEEYPDLEEKAKRVVKTAPLSLVSPYRPPGHEELHAALRNIEGQLYDIARREPQHIIIPPQPAPVVHVTMPPINVTTPPVNVTTPDVTVNVEPAQVTVNLPPPGKTVKTVEYDVQGRPKSITEEPDTKEE